MSAPYHPRLIEILLDDYASQLPALLVVGPRAAGKSTTLRRRAKTVIRLDREAEAGAFEADPDAALSGLEEPVLIDEWQNVPGVLGAVRRAVEGDRRANRFLVTGSVNAELENQVWPGTGRLTRISMYPMTVREQIGLIGDNNFIDRLVAGQRPQPPAGTPDLRGYLDLALQSGFPDAALNLSGSRRDAWLESYIADLLTHDVEQLERSSSAGRRRGRKRDAQRLRRYFEAYAVNSAGIVADKTIYDAAGVNRSTAESYEELLEDLFVTERIDAWFSNRLKRLVRQPKRYVIDAALMAAVMRLDATGVLRDGNVLGRLLDTFVAAQLRPEKVLSKARPRLYHLRTKESRQEIDLLAEVSSRAILAFEVKASAAPKRADAQHLIWLRDKHGTDFMRGVVFHTGPRTYELDERIIAVPISTLWA
jgi:predicted AAA+ superfamily ATPase